MNNGLVSPWRFSYSKFFLIVFLTCGAIIQGFSQTALTDKPLSDLLEEVMDTTNRKATLSYKNVNIINDLDGRSINEYLKMTYGNVLSQSEPGYSDIPKNLKFENCNFQNGLFLDSLKFKAIIIANSKSSGIEIHNCFFNVLNISETESPVIVIENSVFNTLKIDRDILEFNLLLTSLTINKDLIITGVLGNKIVLEDLTTFKNIGFGDNQVGTIEIYNSRFNLPKEGFFRNYAFHSTETFDMVMIDNVFKGDSASSVELRCNYSNLYIENNLFDTDFYFLKSSVQDRMIVVQNQFNSRVSFENFIFSETKNELYWDQFEGYKLAYSRNGEIFDALSDAGLEDEIQFKNLITNYKELHRIFLDRGDLESANACYNEMKELQGIKLRHTYDVEGGFNNLFRWILNRLLKIYTNHGTDPALAVVISFYVILAFALFYFFFPSEWDKESKMELISNYRLQKKNGYGPKTKSILTLSGIVLLSLINAITLSLNSFVTLGFGSIPTKGFPRYLCIIEGFIGWFLLSIFTVALINQVLA